MAENDMRTIKIDKMFFKGTFLKQNLLGFFSCLFVLFFSNVLKTIMINRAFSFGHQLSFVLFFALSMAFLSLMLFQLNFNILK
jgi:hypothetical protein